MDIIAIITAKSERKFLSLPGKNPEFLTYFSEIHMVKAPVNKIMDIKSTLGSYSTSIKEKVKKKYLFDFCTLKYS